MNQSFYKLPLNPVAFTTNEEHKKCSIKDSVAGFLHLLSTTYYGECSFNESFGNALWDVDFDNLTSNDKLRSLISDSLKESIQEFEKRLADVRVEIDLRQETSQLKLNHQIVRKRIDIHIKGKIRQTDEDFFYIEGCYIAPISF